jgi:lycopene cyclase domain-containing protein
VTGAATYLLLDAVFLAVAVVVAVVAAVVASRRVAVRRGGAAVARWRRTTTMTGIVVGVVLVVMTIVFDNVIVGLRIVAYDPARISGLHIGFVPVEDLAYAVAAVLLLPSVAVLVGPRGGRS